MKIALLSDSHGNSTALEAVIQDAIRQQVDEYFFLGDLTMKGPAPEKCLHLIQDLNPLVWVIGNHEPGYTILTEPYKEHAKWDMTVLLNEFDREYLTAAEATFLANLPLTQTVEIMGTKINAFHALPDNPSAGNVSAFDDQSNFDAMFANSDSDIAVYGHVHTQLLRQTMQDQVIINPGTIGMATTWRNDKIDARAQYAILELDDQGIKQVQFCRVEYDVAAEIALARERNIPYLDMYIDLIQNSTSNYWSTDYLAVYNKEHGLDIQAKKIYEMHQK